MRSRVSRMETVVSSRKNSLLHASDAALRWPVLGTFVLLIITSPAFADADAPAADATKQSIAQSYRDLLEKPAAVRRSERPFIEPQTQYSGKDSLETTLRLAYSEQIIPADPKGNLPNPQRVKIRCYNGNMIGPTLRLRPGQRLKITIQNDLPANETRWSDCEPHPPQINVPHGWNCTNLHTHGLHVSPSGNADNVFREIAAASSAVYEYSIPKDHVSGTFWYHPHKHGSVALQVTSGLAGALIIEGGLDDIPEIKAAFERVMAFQQLTFTPDPTKVVSPQPTDIYDRIPARGMARSLRVAAPAPPPAPLDPPLTLINGQLQPVIRMAPGAVERWRFIHAGIETVIRVAVVKDDSHLGGPPDQVTRLDLHEIAVDGIPRGKLTPRPWYEMYPGYRWDVLFKAPDEPGEYFLINERVPPGRELRPGQRRDQPNYLARIVVTGKRRPMKLPHADDLARCLPAQFAPITESELIDPSTGKKRICALTIGIGSGTTFKMDECEYDPDRIDRVARIGCAEEWHLKATKANHPFHIHVNPFEQLVFDGDNHIVDRIWRDTLFLTEKDPFSTVRMRFGDFPGKTVLHCHILDHEDQGMMENLLILGPDEPLTGVKVRVPCNEQAVDKCVEPAVKTGAQGRAPDFELPGTDGRKHRLSELTRTPIVLVFFRGFGCLHCVQQLEALRKAEGALQRAGFRLVAVSSDPEKVLAGAYRSYAAEQKLSCLFLADGELTAFKAFGCYDGAPTHGTFVLDTSRRVRWQRVGKQPFMDVQSIVNVCESLSTAASARK